MATETITSSQSLSGRELQALERSGSTLVDFDHEWTGPWLGSRYRYTFDTSLNGRYEYFSVEDAYPMNRSLQPPHGEGWELAFQASAWCGPIVGNVNTLIYRR